MGWRKVVLTTRKRAFHLTIPSCVNGISAWSYISVFFLSYHISYNHSKYVDLNFIQEKDITVSSFKVQTNNSLPSFSLAAFMSSSMLSTESLQFTSIIWNEAFCFVFLVFCLWHCLYYIEQMSLLSRWKISHAAMGRDPLKWNFFLRWSNVNVSLLILLNFHFIIELYHINNLTMLMSLKRIHSHAPPYICTIIFIWGALAIEKQELYIMASKPFNNNNRASH